MRSFILIELYTSFFMVTSKSIQDFSEELGDGLGQNALCAW